MTGPLAKHSETGGLGARMEEANLIKSLSGGFEDGILRLSVQRHWVLLLPIYRIFSEFPQGLNRVIPLLLQLFQVLHDKKCRAPLGMEGGERKYQVHLHIFEI